MFTTLWGGTTAPACRMICFLELCTLLSLSAANPGADSNAPAPSATLIASPEEGWPQWRGPKRDGISVETGLLQNWPEGGPPLLWKVTGLGKGYSAPIITGERIYLTGDVAEDLLVFALNTQGQKVWSATNGSSWKGPYPGARASCTYAGDRIFHLNAHAQIGCFEAKSGAPVWRADLVERFGSRKITWATSECLLVDGTNVIVTVGGTNALMAALDANSGRTVWSTPALVLGPSTSPALQRVSEPAGEPDPPSYASPILLRYGARRMVVGCSQKHLFGVDAASGELLWTRPLSTQYHVVAMTPVLADDAVFVTAPDTKHGAMYRFLSEGDGINTETAWNTRLDTCHGCVVSIGDSLYGSWYRVRKGWACLNAKDGQVRYETDALAKGSVIHADNRLYALSEQGEMALLRPDDSGFVFEGKFRLVDDHNNDVWTHPVVHKGRMYLRYNETLWCFDVRKAEVSK